MRVRSVTLLACVMMLVPGKGWGQVLANYDYENLAFRGIGVDWGLIWPDKVDATTLWSMRVDLGYLGPAVRLVPGLSWWKSDLRRSELDRLAASLSNMPALQQRGVTITAADLGAIEWSTLSLSLDAHLVWTAPFRIFTFLGAGVGVHAMNGRGASIEDTFVEDLLDTMTPGLALMAGVEYETAPILRLYTEARYTVQGEVKYPGLRLGAALMVPGRTR